MTGDAMRSAWTRWSGSACNGAALPRRGIYTHARHGSNVATLNGHSTFSIRDIQTTIRTPIIAPCASFCYARDEICPLFAREQIAPAFFRPTVPVSAPLLVSKSSESLV
jgi:hypothetical protein